MEWKASPWNCEWTNGRRVYKSSRSPLHCIWWDKKFRHWWVGDCEKQGSNYGSAFLEPDETCPHHGKVAGWKRSGTNEILANGKVIELLSKAELLRNTKENGKHSY